MGPSAGAQAFNENQLPSVTSLLLITCPEREVTGAAGTRRPSCPRHPAGGQGVAPSPHPLAYWAGWGLRPTIDHPSRCPKGPIFPRGSEGDWGPRAAALTSAVLSLLELSSFWCWEAPRHRTPSALLRDPLLQGCVLLPLSLSVPRHPRLHPRHVLCRPSSTGPLESVAWERRRVCPFQECGFGFGESPFIVSQRAPHFTTSGGQMGSLQKAGHILAGGRRHGHGSLVRSPPGMAGLSFSQTPGGARVPLSLRITQALSAVLPRGPRVAFSS